MKLSQQTLAILKNFSRVNSSVMLKKGNFINTRAINGTIYAEATIDDEIDSDFAIYDLNNFLSVVSLVGDDADITVDSKTSTIKIRNSHSTVNFDAADPSTIVYPSKAITFPDASIKFRLKSEEYKQLTRIARSMKIDTLCITNNNKNIVINGYRKAVDAEFEKPLYQTIIGEENDNLEDAEFSFFINMNNLDLIDSDYTVHLLGQGNKIASKFEGVQASYVIALEQNSTHNFG